MSALKKIGKFLTNSQFSKILAFIVTVVWLVATALQYLFNINGISVESMGLTYSEITDTFKGILMYYFGSKTVENVTKIKGSLEEKLKDVAHEMNGKNG